ncbi:hypothetical protein [Pseudoalteromonas sp. S3431]|uniref:hypothetical protein n=1 Tax=Pseudoalteromonas sp. S3431 TaxID=579537 RepID=UPI00049EAFE5|nr:hypothetical protein [Pseudoalteromonas sp. S3431]KDC54720.1 hypothetical protein DO88_07365 [Pseudoalteromonas sp. S3431]
MDFIGVIILLGLILVGVYIYLTWHKEKTKADLTEAVTIFMSAAGLVSSMQLGLIAILEVHEFTGKLADQRIPVIVGAFAILWVSFQAIYMIFEKHYKCHSSVTVSGL